MFRPEKWSRQVRFCCPRRILSKTIIESWNRFAVKNLLNCVIYKFINSVDIINSCKVFFDWFIDLDAFREMHIN